MTSIAVTASICASASEAALLVASFMPFSLDLASQDLGATHRCADTPRRSGIFTRNTPRRVFALLSPHSANIDRARIDHQYGGILARSQPVCARGMEFWKQPSGAAQLRGGCNRLIPPHQPVSVLQWNTPLDRTACNKNHKTQGEKWPGSITATLRNQTNAPGKSWARTATPIFSG